jgi:hypothetical protein
MNIGLVLFQNYIPRHLLLIYSVINMPTCLCLSRCLFLTLSFSLIHYGVREYPRLIPVTAVTIFRYSTLVFTLNGPHKISAVSKLFRPSFLRQWAVRSKFCKQIVCVNCKNPGLKWILHKIQPTRLLKTIIRKRKS